MDFNIDKWLNTYTEAVQGQFGDRVWFIGLQGSYGRGEATETSDIDVVLFPAKQNSKRGKNQTCSNFVMTPRRLLGLSPIL